MGRRTSLALTCALLAGGCVVSGVEEPQDELIVKGGTLTDSLPTNGRYDAAASALGAGARAEFSGQWEAARLAYHAVASTDPDNLRAVMARTRALLAGGHTAQAADMLMTAKQAGPDDPQMVAATGSVLLAAGQPARAIDHLRRAHELQPASLDTTHRLVAALVLAGHHEAAIETLAGTDPADLPDHLLLPVGRSALLADRIDAAAAVFTEAARRNPSDATPWVELGRARLLQRDLAAARDALLTALGLEPSRSDAFVLLGHVRWLSGDIVRATRCWQSALLNGADPAVVGPMLGLAADRAASRSP